MNVKRRGVVLSGETSFHIGGVANDYFVPETLADLARLLEQLAGRRPFLLGGGCNTLFPDGPFQRPIISTERLRRLEVGEGWIRAESGVRLNSLIRTSIEVGLGGLEGFVGIPGSVGGAVVMNAGGSGWSFGERVIELGLIPAHGGDLVRLPGTEIPWGYRGWNLDGHVVGWATIALEPADSRGLRKRAGDFLRQKSRTQPLAAHSAGCVFKNPPGMSAAALIDSLGLKGKRAGGAMVSNRHANFIVNKDGRASSADVLRLVEEIRGRVEERFGIRLETEIVIAEDVKDSAPAPAG